VSEFDWPLKLAPGTNLLKLLISSRGRSKPTDRFRRIPTLGIRMLVHNPESHRILSAGWIRSDSLTWAIHMSSFLLSNDEKHNSLSCFYPKLLAIKDCQVSFGLPYASIEFKLFSFYHIKFLNVNLESFHISNDNILYFLT
jgi:hypothetical protein